MMQIYIPLWFYSNDYGEYIDMGLNKFTFHYGSILIRKTYMKSANIKIYIPLWFYSNFLPPVSLFHLLLIYIPLWFYSNDLKNLRHKRPSTFTFHYGSILMELLFRLLIREK